MDDGWLGQAPKIAGRHSVGVFRKRYKRSASIYYTTHKRQPTTTTTNAARAREKEIQPKPSLTRTFYKAPSVDAGASTPATTNRDEGRPSVGYMDQKKNSLSQRG